MASNIVSLVFFSKYSFRDVIVVNFLQTKVLAVFGFILISGCAGTMFQPLAPDVEITRVELSGIQFPMTEMLFSLDVSNPNDFDIHVSYIDMKLHVQDYLMTSERWTNIAVLFSHQKQSMQVPVKIDIMNALTLLPELMSDNKVPYVISGSVKLKNHSKVLPFVYKGDFNSRQISNVTLNDKVDNPVKKSYRF